jgi:hypothetical protein
VLGSVGLVVVLDVVVVFLEVVVVSGVVFVVAL